ncbi:histidine phosphatase superfamily clade-2 protein [Venturia nashicola]|uniref:Histidine phosphatase superfamily clade-2 protein n=1 Tax=Venturia nashicola TaxID=86259 RepID=A0A4Z1NYF3_9PEZI|nr:histidine phosphatase superfamily clade-2 protein [Venturia nashicola]
MKSFLLSALVAVAQAVPAHKSSKSAQLIDDIGTISKYWGQLSPYSENPDDIFGVEDVGLPDGCQIEQAHTLQRHSNRFPTSAFDDGANDAHFAAKISNYTLLAKNNTDKFTGPLSFLNSWGITFKPTGLLTGLGAASEFESGVMFWNRYGRILYNASVAQLSYNASFTNGTARPKPVLRTTDQSRIENSQINWSLGFFGTSFQTVPNKELEGFTDPFDLVIIPEGVKGVNDTLASYDSCINGGWVEPLYELGDLDILTYLPIYLKDATARLQKYAPDGITFTLNDTYAMQSICAYETGYIGQSDFCGLFTLDEWTGFENTLDMEYYYDYSYGSPSGRAQGIGYLQELLARLQSEYIFTSNSSVNSTITNNPRDFPLGRPFYADFSHDDILISTMTAMSLDYFKDPPSLTEYPPDPKRKFILSQITPFTARLNTEVIGCSSPNPKAQKKHRTQYTPGQYGYDPSNARHKFIRMRLNSGILPLETIRGGGCEGRSDGLCALEDFIESQKNAYELSQYDWACFGNYTIQDPTSGQDFDGAVVRKGNETVY